jgi:PGF-pre-PGF domain-containing protein
MVMRMNHKSKNNVIISMDVVKKIIANYISFLIILVVISHAFIPFVLAKPLLDRSTEPLASDAVANTPAASVVSGDDSDDDIVEVETDDSNEVDDDSSEDDSLSNPAADKVADTPAVNVLANTPAAVVVDVNEDNNSSEDDSLSNPAADKVADTPAALVANILSVFTLYNNSSEENNTEFVEITSTSETDLGEITEGKETIINPENEQESGISQVIFTSSSALKEVKFTVSSYSGKPYEVTDIAVDENVTPTIYKYLDIKLTSNETYVGETGIASMTFTFTVEKSWIFEKNIDKQTVEMLRYHDDEWQHLNTTLISENDTVIVYEAETPGLSTFAVVGSEIVEVSASYVEETNEISWILNVVIIFSSTIILGVVLVKARFIYKNETKQ